MSWGSRTALLVTLALVAVGCGTSESRREDTARSQIEPRLVELQDSARGALERHADAGDASDAYTHREVIDVAVVGDVVTWTLAVVTLAGDPRSWGYSSTSVGGCLVLSGTAGDGENLAATAVECPRRLLDRARQPLNVEIDLLED